MKGSQLFLTLLYLLENASAFGVQPPNSQRAVSVEPTRLSPLFMGRAAAVRASTKAKTDMKKAKTNALFGKKLIMAVKEGGSPDPNANRKLYDLIKQAKASSVPMDNINRASEYYTIARGRHKSRVKRDQ